MRSIRDVRAALRAQSESLGPLLTRHRAVTRVSVAAVALAIVFAISQQSPSQAGRAPERPPVASSLLPQNVGIGIATDQAVTLTFAQPMDHASVEAALRVTPSQPLAYGWSPDGRSLRVAPTTRWQTDARYVLEVPGVASTSDGGQLGSPARVSFTTETAPTIADFQLRFTPATALAPGLEREPAGEQDAAIAAPADTAAQVSSRTAITLAFSTAMDRAATEAAFVISPEIEGRFSWLGDRLTFHPAAALAADSRYAITLAGARDAEGNRLGGDTSFSFTTRDGAQLASVSPNIGESDVTGRTLSLRFSEPMNAASVAEALSVVDSSGAAIAGDLSWNDAQTHLTFTAEADLPAGRRITVTIDGASDLDGQLVDRSYSFYTRAAVVAAPARTLQTAPAPRPALAVPAPSSDAVVYALNQVNAARAQYGFAPLALDSAISQVANAHAWDMMRTGSFSHTGSDGSSVRTRLSRAGVSYNQASENICYHSGIGVMATLDWCHSTFMSEPYPGYYNHKGNILNPDFRRIGIGIASWGGKVYVVWDFVG